MNLTNWITCSWPAVPATTCPRWARQTGPLPAHDRRRKTMRTFCKSILALAVVAACAVLTSAQEMPLPEGTTVKLILLRQKSVQTELKLAAEAVDKVMKFT